MHRHCMFYNLLILLVLTAATMVRGWSKTIHNGSMARCFRSEDTLEFDMCFAPFGEPEIMYLSARVPDHAFTAPRKYLLFCTMTSTELKVAVKINYKTVMEKKVNLLLDPFTGKIRSIRMVMNKERLTVTLLPVVFQASLSFDLAFPLDVLYLQTVTYDTCLPGHFRWYYEIVPIRWVPEKLLAHVGVAKDRAKVLHKDTSGTTNTRLSIKYKAIFKQISLYVNVKKDQGRPFTFSLANSAAKVTVTLSCQELTLTVEWLPATEVSEKTVLKTSIFGACDQERQVLAQYNHAYKRLTVTVLPLSAQAFLMEDRTEEISQDFDVLEVLASDFARPWSADIVPLSNFGYLSTFRVDTQLSKQSGGASLKGFLSPRSGNLTIPFCFYYALLLFTMNKF